MPNVSSSFGQSITYNERQGNDEYDMETTNASLCQIIHFNKSFEDDGFLQSKLFSES